jgi:N-methylhydantoinase B
MAAKPLTSKAAGLRLKKDDVLTLQFAGGGGWGDPLERPAERVQRDVACGYVSRQAARDAYGVAVTDDLSIDPEATARLRGAKAAS